ncbi:MAG: SDR family NAD(P)-dependent oxidoreductase [Pseudomonadota bacterium]
MVAGAGSGVGEATSSRFSRDGFNVVLNGRSREKLEKIAADLPGERGDVDAMMDVTVERFGGRGIFNTITASLPNRRKAKGCIWFSVVKAARARRAALSSPPPPANGS